MACAPVTLITACCTRYMDAMQQGPRTALLKTCDTGAPANYFMLAVNVLSQFK